ncbi:MAG: hypothetical protein FJX19_08615, partial [Alphaproteobacteria bacterium]|nr:hypothetical protein [Alphaproteobacteria bacterium]
MRDRTGSWLCWSAARESGHVETGFTPPRAAAGGCGWRGGNRPEEGRAGAPAWRGSCACPPYRGKPRAAPRRRVARMAGQPRVTIRGAGGGNTRRGRRPGMRSPHPATVASLPPTQQGCAVMLSRRSLLVLSLATLPAAPRDTRACAVQTVVTVTNRSSRAIRAIHVIGPLFEPRPMRGPNRLGADGLVPGASAAIGSMAGLEVLLGQAGARFGDLDCIVHGSTIVTNMLIERKGSRTALLTTRGFRDTLELGIEQRYDIHDLFLKFPAPLVPRALRFEITARMSRDGKVLKPLDMAEVHEAVAAAAAAGARAIAVMFLHSYRNDAHERAVGQYIRREFPELHVTLSCEVGGEIRE